TPVPVYVNGKLADWPQKAIVRDGKTYAPLRPAAEALKAHVTWHPENEMAVVCLGDQCVPIRKSQGIVVGGRLYIPLRLMAQALRCKVAWDAAKRAVMIETALGTSGN
ncbi:MAG: copper amine oxidase N-terminal domain-containing protein, partial [Armatimonadetes bacterium]|nr:copper amine oxidase N-terminal domain-containing protein [Armatimonadota bacterium]